MTTKTETPWGTADYHRQIAEGIDWYSTPSHGGFILSNERLEAMPDRFKNFKPWAGPVAFEEDCDWVVAVLSFPDCFEPQMVRDAQQSFDGNLSYYVERGASIS